MYSIPTCATSLTRNLTVEYVIILKFDCSCCLPETPSKWSQFPFSFCMKHRIASLLICLIVVKYTYRWKVTIQIVRIPLTVCFSEKWILICLILCSLDKYISLVLLPYLKEILFAFSFMISMIEIICFSTFTINSIDQNYALKADKEISRCCVSHWFIRLQKWIRQSDIIEITNQHILCTRGRWRIRSYVMKQSTWCDVPLANENF
jgi:hypothetical protein